MKKSLVLLGVLILAGCGMSESEQTRIAEAACSALGATSKEDSLDRVQIINVVRQELGAEIFSGSGDEVERYLRFGVCVDFVRNKSSFMNETVGRVVYLWSNSMISIPSMRSCTL